jgi:hypothetical protein
LIVGASTLAAVLGDKLVPGLLDRYLGRTGYQSQQTDVPEDPKRSDNLWQPVAGDHGAHGEFDERAHGTSIELWAVTHPAVVAAGAATAGALLLRRGRRRNSPNGTGSQ